MSIFKKPFQVLSYNKSSKVKLSPRHRYNRTYPLDNENIIESIFYKLSLNREYKLSKKLYSTSNKVIYLIQLKKNNNKCVLKISTDESMGQKLDLLNFLKNNRNENILTCLGYGEIHTNGKGYYYIIYPYFTGVNLVRYIDTHPDISEQKLEHIFGQIVSLVQYLHRHNVVHSDLKLENIIIDEHNTVALIDFDLSFICENNEGVVFDSSFGTIQYIAPESYDLHLYSKKSDVWQVGVILFILVTHKYPVNDNNKLSFGFSDSYHNFYGSNCFKNLNLDIFVQTIYDKKYSEDWNNIVKGALEFEDNKRASVDDLASMVKKIDNKIV